MQLLQLSVTREKQFLEELGGSGLAVRYDFLQCDNQTLET